MTAPTYFRGAVDYSGFFLHHCVHYMDLPAFLAASPIREISARKAKSETGVMLPACAVTNRCSRTGATSGVHRQDLRLPGWTGFAHHRRQGLTPES